MRLTKSTSHAIRILIDCAQSDGRLMKVAELSDRLGITQQNVFKIVNMLARSRLIGATRGRNGGVRLARPASEIRIGDVVRATEVTHVEIEDGAVEQQSTASRDVNRVLDHALGAFIEVLDQHTIADMAKAQRASEAGNRKSAAPELAPPVPIRSRRTGEQRSR